MERCPVNVEILDLRHVFLLDAGAKIYIWCGRKSNLVTRTKARLIAEKINKNERKGAAEITQFGQGKETGDFWKLIGGPPESMEVTVRTTTNGDIVFRRMIWVKIDFLSQEFFFFLILKICKNLLLSIWIFFCLFFKLIIC